MKLIDLIKTINNNDDELVIYMQDINDLNSDIMLVKCSEDNSSKMDIKGKSYYYLLEVSIAKEVIVDWKNTLNYTPSDYDIAQRVIEYAINDA